MVSEEKPPIFAICKSPMGICKRAKSKHVGITNTYKVSIPTYGCCHKNCKGHLSNLVTSQNPFAAPRMTFDYDVQTEITYIRWHEHATYMEIIDRLEERFNIIIDRTAIELTLKCYEIGCAKYYRSFFDSQIKENGGVSVNLDLVEPLKSRIGFLVTYDYWTGLTLGVKRMSNGKQTTYEVFLTDLKNRISTEIGVPITGIIFKILDQTSARREIRDNRRNRESLIFEFHDNKRWENRLNKIDEYISNLKGN